MGPCWCTDFALRAREIPVFTDCCTSPSINSSRGAKRRAPPKAGLLLLRLWWVRPEVDPRQRKRPKMASGTVPEYFRVFQSMSEYLGVPRPPSVRPPSKVLQSMCASTGSLSNVFYGGGGHLTNAQTDKLQGGYSHIARTVTPKTHTRLFIRRFCLRNRQVRAVSLH